MALTDRELQANPNSPAVPTVRAPITKNMDVLLLACNAISARIVVKHSAKTMETVSGTPISPVNSGKQSYGGLFMITPCP